MEGVVFNSVVADSQVIGEAEEDNPMMLAVEDNQSGDRVFWSPDDDKSGRLQNIPSCVPNSPPEILSNDRHIKDKIKSALCKFDFWVPYDLIQFWAPKTIGGRCFLTTEDQPFALTHFRKGICWYRKHSLSLRYELREEDELGPIRRAFLHNSPELTPDVSYYSSKEYPLRDLPANRRLKTSWALPLSEPSGDCCVGLLEIRSTVEVSWFEISFLIEHLKDTDLKVSSPLFCGFNSRGIDEDEGQRHALDEISEGLKVVCQTHKLPFAQTWIPCRHSNDAPCGGELENRCNGQFMSTVKGANYIDDDGGDVNLFEFYLSCKLCHLGKGKGVVGRAFSSHKSCFCKDITKFSVTDYPMVYYARKYELTGCFAICLKSKHNENNVYVLEFFLPPSDTDYRDLQVLLNLLLGTMKEQFRSFKVAYGQEVGEELFVEVVKFSMDDELDSFQICQTTITPPRSDALRNRERTEVNSSDQHAIKDGGNSASRVHGSIVPTHSKNEGVIMTLEREPKQYCFSIGFEDVKKHFGRNIEDAAESLGVSRSTLKRICRRNGILRWPSHKRKKVCHSVSKPNQVNESIRGVEVQITESSPSNPQCSDLPGKQDTTIVPQTMPHVTPIQDASTVMIKAAYGGEYIKFRFSFLHGVTKLEEEVAKRLNLKAGTFKMRYLDEEGEWIRLTYDDELQLCMDLVRSLGRPMIRMSVELITNQPP